MFDQVISADWSKDPAKRWMAIAERRDAGWLIREVTRVPDPPLGLLPRDGRALIGFDFPVGVPAAYAQEARLDSFRDLLLAAGEGRLAAFYEPASRPDEISLVRPFYPWRPGGTSRKQLTDALGMDAPEALYRACERRTPDRPAASPLFWILGAKQVGRAAITGWRDVLAPALRSPEYDLALWPFDGALEELARGHHLVACETYPAEGCRHLGFPRRGWSKRKGEDRRALASTLFEHAATRGVELASSVRRQVACGFLDGAAGEDPFDAFVALADMLDVVDGRRPAHPFDELPLAVARHEGWILGQTSYGEVERRSQDES